MLLTLLEHGTAKETGVQPWHHRCATIGSHSRHGPHSVRTCQWSRAWTAMISRRPGHWIDILESIICGGFRSGCVFLCLFVSFWLHFIGEDREDEDELNRSQLPSEADSSLDSSAAFITCYWHLNSAIRIQCHQCDWFVYAQGLFWLDHCFREINSYAKGCQMQSMGLWSVLGSRCPFFFPLAQCWKRLEGWELTSLPVADWKRSREKRKRMLCTVFFSAGCLKWSKWCQWIDCNRLVGHSIPPGDDLFRLTWSWWCNWHRRRVSKNRSQTIPNTSC